MQLSYTRVTASLTKCLSKTQPLRTYVDGLQAVTNGETMNIRELETYVLLSGGEVTEADVSKEKLDCFPVPQDLPGKWFKLNFVTKDKKQRAYVLCYEHDKGPVTVLCKLHVKNDLGVQIVPGASYDDVVAVLTGNEYEPS